MRVVIIWREDSEYGREVSEWLHEFKRRTGKDLESLSPDDPDGESLAQAYDVTNYPAILAISDDGGKLQQSWIGMEPSLPRIDDVNYCLIEQ